MIAGLWLEPEVDRGHAARWPTSCRTEAFLQRGGVRVVEHDRYHLDLRHPAARAHLDEVVDRLVGELGVGYFKLDYNINPGPGTDLDADSVGDGLLEHNRAHLAWLDGVLDRHPTLVLENCGSGAHAHGLRRAVAPAAAVHLRPAGPPALPADRGRRPRSHILPEQAANWAYPQPQMTDEEIAFTMCTGLAGRLYLSGT